jgi:hypothetical protein
MKGPTSMKHMLLAIFLLIAACSSSRLKNINAKKEPAPDPN